MGPPAPLVARCHASRDLNTMSNLSYVEMSISRDGAVISKAQIREMRIRQGFCTECRGEPVQLYNIRKNRLNPLWSAKEPLSVDGESFNGQCLRCYPELNPRRRSLQHSGRHARRLGTDSDDTAAEASRRSEEGSTDSNPQSDARSHARRHARNSVAQSTTTEILIPALDPSGDSSQTKVVDLDFSVSNRSSTLSTGSSHSLSHSHVEDLVVENDCLELMYARCRRQSSMRSMRQSSFRLSSSHLAVDRSGECSMQLSDLAREWSQTTSQQPLDTTPEPARSSRGLNPTNETEPSSDQSHDSPADFENIVSELQLLIKDLSATGDSDFAADVIVDAMHQYPKVVAIQSFCLQTISDLATAKEANKSSIISTSAPDDILLAMTNHMTSVEIQTRGCGAMRDLATSPQNRLLVARAGAPARIVLALVEHKANEDFARAAIGALRTLSTESEVREHLRPLQAPQRVAELMAIHISVVSIQRDGCAFLSNSAVDMDKQQVAVATPDELEAIVRAMAAHQNEQSVMTGVCFALKNYTYEEGNLRTLRQCRDVFTLLEYASQNGEHHSCRQDAAVVLDRIEMSRVEDESLEVQAYDSLVLSVRQQQTPAYAVKAAIDAMKEYEWSEKISAGCIQCLQTIAVQSTSQPSPITGKVVETVIATMNRFEASSSVQVSCSGLLESLAETSLKKQYEIINAKGCKAIVKALRHHRDDENVLKAALAALKSLSQTFECWFELEQNGDVPAVQEAVQAHPQIVELQLLVSEILINFSAHTAALS